MLSGLLDDVRFVNPDSHTLDLLTAQGYSGFGATPPDVLAVLFRQSADAVYKDLSAALQAGEAVGVETVLSTPKYRPLVSQVTEAGGFVGLVFVFLASPELAVQRVATRVARGGHDVPADKIAQRWHRSLVELAWFAKHATAFFVFDNSNSDTAVAPPLVAHGMLGRLTSLRDDAPKEIRIAVESLSR